MKHTFAKIIELDNHQVLVTKDFNSETDKYEVTITTHLDGVAPSATLGFATEEKAHECWNQFDQDQAEAFVHQMNDVFKAEQ